MWFSFDARLSLWLRLLLNLEMQHSCPTRYTWYALNSLRHIKWRLNKVLHLTLRTMKRRLNKGLQIAKVSTSFWKWVISVSHVISEQSSLVLWCYVGSYAIVYSSANNKCLEKCLHILECLSQLTLMLEDERLQAIPTWYECYWFCVKLSMDS